MTSDLTDPYIEITSWLVSAYDFYSRVVKDYYMSVKMSVQRSGYMILATNVFFMILRGRFISKIVLNLSLISVS